VVDAGTDLQVIEAVISHVLAVLPVRIGVEAAALELGLSTERVADAFRRAGVNPRDHLRRARLLLLHEDLTAGRFIALGEAFARWGFPPRSQDAVADYRKLFGCTPARTLARCA
jgi:hypothetical protein